MRTLFIEITIALLGTFFGIALYNSEAASFYRIQEMFHFDSFHMYGIIGAAVVLGAFGIQVFRRMHWHDIEGKETSIEDKENTPFRYLVGGSLFGLGWALVGACPGPQFVLLGAGWVSLAVVIASGIMGTYLYGLVRNHIKH